MFDDLQVSPNEVLLYIAELYIRNMKSLETIALLKEQLKQIEDYKQRVDRANKERDNAVALANSYEAKIFELNKVIKELEDKIASISKDKKRGKK